MVLTSDNIYYKLGEMICSAVACSITQIVTLFCLVLYMYIDILINLGWLQASANEQIIIIYNQSESWYISMLAQIKYFSTLFQQP